MKKTLPHQERTDNTLGKPNTKKSMAFSGSQILFGVAEKQGLAAKAVESAEERKGEKKGKEDKAQG